MPGSGGGCSKFFLLTFASVALEEQVPEVQEVTKAWSQTDLNDKDGRCSQLPMCNPILQLGRVM